MIEIILTLYEIKCLKEGIPIKIKHRLHEDEELIIKKREGNI